MFCLFVSWNMTHYHQIKNSGGVHCGYTKIIYYQQTPLDPLTVFITFSQMSGLFLLLLICHWSQHCVISGMLRILFADSQLSRSWLSQRYYPMAVGPVSRLCWTDRQSLSNEKWNVLKKVKQVILPLISPLEVIKLFWCHARTSQ